VASIVMADDGIPFDGATAAAQPLGGAESAFVGLAEALAARGHRVLAYTRGAAPLERSGVGWRPLGAAPPPAAADLYVANRGDRLLRLVPAARACAFWVHNPARYLRKWRFLWKLAWRRPTIVFTGPYHASTCPPWVPGRRLVIPLGVEEVFRAAAERPPPPPRAVFTSNPRRGLDWLLECWTRLIRPAVPGAELHVFSGAETYGVAGAAQAAAMAGPLARARALGDAGVVLRGALPKTLLAKELRRARVFLYPGDPGETFCLAAAEAQASGLPGVVRDVGPLGERVRDGETGFVARDEGGFAAAAVALLADDALWRRQHRAALLSQGGCGWPEAAAAWEDAFLGPPQP
jgi:glycosyltransferase involved in cell wall biosynthesis